MLVFGLILVEDDAHAKPRTAYKEGRFWDCSREPPFMVERVEREIKVLLLNADHHLRVVRFGVAVAFDVHHIYAAVGTFCQKLFQELVILGQ